MIFVARTSLPFMNLWCKDWSLYFWKNLRCLVNYPCLDSWPGIYVCDNLAFRILYSSKMNIVEIARGKTSVYINQMFSTETAGLLHCKVRHQVFVDRAPLSAKRGKQTLAWRLHSIMVKLVDIRDTQMWECLKEMSASCLIYYVL